MFKQDYAKMTKLRKNRHFIDENFD
jgi:hypothetical protein